MEDKVEDDEMLLMIRTIVVQDEEMVETVELEQRLKSTMDRT